MESIFRRAAQRALLVCASVAAVAVLSACDGPASTSQPIDLTVTATDASTTTDVGHSATVSFTVSNPTSADVAGVNVLISSGAGSYLYVESITCSAQGGTCPDTSNAWIKTFSMPAGARYKFTAAMSEVVPVTGDQTATVSVTSYVRQGALDAAAHVSAVDGRSGHYDVFTAGGMNLNLDVAFNSGTSTFAASFGNADKTFTTSSDDTYAILPSGGHFSSGPDLLVGQADFGLGLDTFIATRSVVMTLPELDGKTFSTFNVARPAAAGASGPASGASGQLSLQQVAIAGTTLTTCTDGVGVIASCDPAQLHAYALSGNTGVFAAEDDAHDVVISFQVARSGASLIYLRANTTASGSLLGIGFADAAPIAEEHDAYVTLGSRFGVLDVTGTSWSFLDQKPAGDFGPSPDVPLAPASGGLPGLMTGIRPSDGAQLMVLHSGVLTLTATPAGEFGIAIDRIH